MPYETKQTIFMETKLFKEMTADEQLRYVTDLTSFVDEKLPVLEKLGDAWELSHRKDMETGLQLIAAFQFARDFVDKAVRYGDYAARVYRLRTYFNKIKDEIAKGNFFKASDGKTYAIVPPAAPQAPRRGRPASAATIARREAEAEAAKKQVEMFKDTDSTPPTGTPPLQEAGSGNPMPNGSKEGAQPSPYSPPLSGEGLGVGSASIPAMPQVESKLHLNQLAWLCSEETARAIETVQKLRYTSEAASERAKLLAEQGASAEVIEPYAKQATDAVNAYMAIYAQVDEELATVWYRLQNDEPYRERFVKRFKGVDLIQVGRICRPYYEKVKSPEFDLRMKTLIEQESPEFVAKQKADAEKKKEVQDILRYLKRKDKGPSEARVKTAKEKFHRLEELLGKKEAADYKPLVRKIEDDFKALKKSDKG